MPVFGVFALVVGLPLTYRGFQKRGAVRGFLPYERLRASLSVPELMLGISLGILGAVLLGICGGLVS